MIPLPTPTTSTQALLESFKLYGNHSQLNSIHTISLLIQNPPSLIKPKSKLLLYLMRPYMLSILHVGCSHTNTELGMTFQVHLLSSSRSLPVPPAPVTLASLGASCTPPVQSPQGLCASSLLLEHTWSCSALTGLLSFSSQHLPLNTFVCCLLSSWNGSPREHALTH